MAHATSQSVDGLRARWERQWLRAAAGTRLERSSLLQIHVTLHAASHLLARISEPLAPDLADLLAVHEELGRSASSRLVGELALTAEVLRHALPAHDLGACVVPVMSRPGHVPLRVERSRPGWHLNGSAVGVPWSPDVERLAVFAIDEGDNDVMVLVAPDAARMGIASSPTGGGRELVDIGFDDVTLAAVVACPGAPGALADRLTVLALADVIGAAGWLLDGPCAGFPRGRAELRLCRASLRAAARSSTTANVVRRQHDVSAAALLVLSTCLRIADAAADRDDPAARLRVQRIRDASLALPDWHGDRLQALV